MARCTELHSAPVKYKLLYDQMKVYIMPQRLLYYGLCTMHNGPHFPPNTGVLHTHTRILY